MSDQTYRDVLFELQLVLEDETADQIRQRAANIARVWPNGDRIGVALFAHAALLRSPALSCEEQEQKLEALCEGLDITIGDILDALADAQRSRDAASE